MKTCPTCQQEFNPKLARYRFCSVSCASRYNRAHGKKREIKPVGKWHIVDGYILRYEWSGDKRHAVLQHRYAMEQHLGRALTADEHIHHINGIKTDNRIENLQIIDVSAHTTLHNNKREYRKGYKLNLTDEQRAQRAELARRRCAEGTFQSDPSTRRGRKLNLSDEERAARSERMKKVAAEYAQNPKRWESKHAD